MEANVYRFLKSRSGIIDVLYEPLYFPFSKDAPISGYIPDFKVIIKQGYYFVEVKGCEDIYSLDEESYNQATLILKEYRRDIGIGYFLITYNEYRKIEKHYAHRIKNWE